MGFRSIWSHFMHEVPGPKWYWSPEFCFWSLIRSRFLALISAPTYFVTSLKWRFLKEKLKASLYYPASVISALWVGGKDRWRGEGDKARGYSSRRGGEGGGAARSNPDRISDQKMSFSTAILEPSKIYSRIQTWHIDIDDIYMYQENWSETDENMCPNFYEQTFFFLNKKHENFCVTQLTLLLACSRLSDSMDNA